MVDVLNLMVRKKVVLFLSRPVFSFKKTKCKLIYINKKLSSSALDIGLHSFRLAANASVDEILFRDTIGGRVTKPKMGK